MTVVDGMGVETWDGWRWGLLVCPADDHQAASVHLTTTEPDDGWGVVYRTWCGNGPWSHSEIGFEFVPVDSKGNKFCTTCFLRGPTGGEP